MKEAFKLLNEFQRCVLIKLASFPDTEMSNLDLINGDDRHQAYVGMHALQEAGFITNRHQKSSKYGTLGFYKITQKGLDALKGQPVPIA